MSNGLFTFVWRAYFYCDKILWTRAIDFLKRGKKMISREVIPFGATKWSTESIKENKISLYNWDF